MPGVLFLATGLAAKALRSFAGPDWLDWAALHLILLGGVSQILLGSAQFFACAFLATDPPSIRRIVSQITLWNAGTALVAVGVPLGVPALTGIGATLILFGLLLFVASLESMRRASLQSRIWAVRWYETSAAFLAIGVLAGAGMALVPEAGFMRMLAAHVCVNVLGWFGTSIVGTLHTFFPSLVGERLAWPRLEPATYALWVGGVVLLAAALAWVDAIPAAVGAILLLASSVILVANLASTTDWRVLSRSFPAMLVGAGQLLLPAAFLLALSLVLAEGAPGLISADGSQALRILVIAGWIGFTVAGSLLHLTGVLARVRSGFSYRLPVSNGVVGPAAVVGATVGLLGLALSTLPGSAVTPWAGFVFLLPAGTIVSWRLAVSLLTAARGPGLRPAGPRP